MKCELAGVFFNPLFLFIVFKNLFYKIENLYKFDKSFSEKLPFQLVRG